MAPAPGCGSLDTDRRGHVGTAGLVGPLQGAAGLDPATTLDPYPSTYQPLPRENFAVVGVALDTDKAQLAKYLQGKPIPWPQLHETGGLDGRLAEELGVLTLPTMLLIDADGKVVDRNLVITDLEKKLEAMVGGK